MLQYPCGHGRSPGMDSAAIYHARCTMHPRRYCKQSPNKKSRERKPSSSWTARHWIRPFILISSQEGRTVGLVHAKQATVHLIAQEIVSRLYVKHCNDLRLPCQDCWITKTNATFKLGGFYFSISPHAVLMVRSECTILVPRLSRSQMLPNPPKRDNVNNSQ
jgi:hypothetical protein